MIVGRAVPNIVGVDIGCGMYTVNLGNVDIDFQKLDEAAHFIPSGKNVWEGRQEKFDLTRLRCYRSLKDTKGLAKSLGTLGGGNHFIEVDEAEYKAAGRRSEIQSALKQLRWEKKESLIPDDLCYSYGSYLEDYLHDIVICQEFARASREKILFWFTREPVMDSPCFPVLTYPAAG